MFGKVALLFWGLTRGLKHVQYSIMENIVYPLTNSGYQVDIFIHTYYFKGEYTNERHNISSMKLDFDEYKLLNPKYFLIEDQDEVKKKLDLKKFRKQKDHFKNGYQSNDFYILSLYSQSQITRLFMKHKEEYRFCFFVRPDVKFLKPININWLGLVQPNTILVPGWANYKHKKAYSENDRFCICHPDDAYKYGDLLEILLPYSKHQPIVAEFFLGFALNVFHKMNVSRIHYIFQRVLPNGEIHKSDIKLR